MKTARVPLTSALLLLIAVLAWGGGALHGQLVQPRPTTKLDSALLDTYVGQYELAPKVLLTLRREGHNLMARITGQPWIVVYAGNETRFFWKVVPAQFTIQKDKDGKVEGLLFEQGKTKIRAKRVSGELPEEVELPEPNEVVQSPRLITLTKDLQSANREAIKQFWKEVQDKGPLVEPVKGDAHSSWVTFLWRGNDKTRRVSVTGGLPTHQAIYPILNGTALRRGAAVCCSCRATILSAQASKQLRGLLCLDCLARSPAAPLGQRLSSLRIIAEMTQAQLSEATGISSSYISSLEIGQHRPSVKTRVRLLEFLEAVVAKPSKP